MRMRQDGTRAVVLAAVVAAGLGWTGAQAMWAELTDPELVAGSELIVLGTLSEMRIVDGPAAGAPPQTVGVVAVEAVLKGDPDTAEVLIAVPQPGAPVSSTDLAPSPGQDGLWFLRRIEPDAGATPAATPAATHAADHPQRFVPRTGAAARIEEIGPLLDP